jgi:hypothetical protein
VFSQRELSEERAREEAQGSCAGGIARSAQGKGVEPSEGVGSESE